MSLFKKNIILIFILIASLAIVSAYADQPAAQLNKNGEKQAEENLERGTKKVLLFLKTSEQLTDHQKVILSDDSKESENSGDNPLNVFPEQKTENQEQFSDNQSPKILSLETILAQIENLSADLKLQFEKYQSQNCSACDQKTDSTLEEYSSSIGYRSWQEYSLSKQYYLAREYFLANQDSLLKKPSSENNSSTCANILAGGAEATCSCNDPSCYTDTPKGRYYHCAGPCCCVCCSICCR
ncbi:MAG: hypothetical protein ABIF84_01235 [Patescibacteria group bacterium]